FFDPVFAPLVEQLAPKLPLVRGFVALCERSAVPSVKGVSLLCYDDLLADASLEYSWPIIDENAASTLCYTSGTTGNPKGVLYSHRSTVLHAYGLNIPDVFGLRAVDRVLPVVPMFHVNAWGTPYGAPMVGAALIMPGRHLDGASLSELMNTERVTIAAGVPTVWLGL